MGNDNLPRLPSLKEVLDAVGGEQRTGSVDSGRRDRSLKKDSRNSVEGRLRTINTTYSRRSMLVNPNPYHNFTESEIRDLENEIAKYEHDNDSECYYDGAFDSQISKVSSRLNRALEERRNFVEEERRVLAEIRALDEQRCLDLMEEAGEYQDLARKYIEGFEI